MLYFKSQHIGGKMGQKTVEPKEVVAIILQIAQKYAQSSEISAEHAIEIAREQFTQFTTRCETGKQQLWTTTPQTTRSMT
jgi:hypothetical protein